MPGPTRQPTLKIGLLTTDATNTTHASQCAEKTGDTVVADTKLDALQRSGVDAVLYDLDHLRIFGDPLALVVPGAARLQVAFSANFAGRDVRRLRGQGVIVCRRLKSAVRLVAKLLRVRPAAAA
jgi:hypothetical protein